MLGFRWYVEELPWCKMLIAAEGTTSNLQATRNAAARNQCLKINSMTIAIHETLELPYQPRSSAPRRLLCIPNSQPVYATFVKCIKMISGPKGDTGSEKILQFGIPLLPIVERQGEALFARWAPTGSSRGSLYYVYRSSLCTGLSTQSNPEDSRGS